MFPLSVPRFTANGNIRPGRFLTTVSGNGNFLLVVEATAATQTIVGVSGRYVRYAPGSPGDDGFIAIAGEPVEVHTALMEAELKLGGTVSDGGIPLTTDGSGQGVATAPADGTNTRYGALPLRAGQSGDFIPVWVLPPTFTQ